MKSKGCDRFLEAVLTVETPLSGEAAEHVRHCPECAALREQAAGFAGKCELEPPEALDRAVLAHARSANRRRSVHQLIFRRIVPFAAAAAAAVVCVAVLLPEEPAGGRPSQIARVEAPVRTAENPAVAALERLESEAFDLSQELTSCQVVLSDWSAM